MKGLVTIPSLHGAELDNTFQLWDGITASEYLPANSGTKAFYILTLSKSASDYKAVDGILEELKKALDLLARSWIFACGVSMNTTFRETLHLPEFQDNAKEVRKALLKLKGTVRLSGSGGINFEAIAQYPQPPLAMASKIAIAMHGDPALARLLQYYHHAWVNYFRPGGRKASWFIDLYKVRDFFKVYYTNSKIARERLKITSNDWGFIGNILDHGDLRHADVTGTAPEASKEDIATLFQISKTAIMSFLQSKGLTETTPPHS